MALQDTIDKLNDLDLSEIDFSDIDFDNIGSWPLAGKIVIWIVVFAVVVGASYKLNLESMHQRLAASEQQEVQLRDDFEKKVNEAANLEAYRAQMIEMEQSFDALLKQLPQDTEVPGLLEDISNKGMDSGLTFKSIDLKPEKVEDFYIELPIEISVEGGYHDFGSFVSGIAGLPRIVTLHDFAVNSKSTVGGRGELSMQITAKTYRYKAQGEG